jgi:hypothetical protein
LEVLITLVKMKVNDMGEIRAPLHIIMKFGSFS